MSTETDLVGGLLHTGPAAQDERVVAGDDSDNINALGLELLVLGYVRREVVGVA